MLQHAGRLAGRLAGAWAAAPRGWLQLQSCSCHHRGLSFLVATTATPSSLKSLNRLPLAAGMSADKGHHHKAIVAAWLSSCRWGPCHFSGMTACSHTVMLWQLLPPHPQLYFVVLLFVNKVIYTVGLSRLSKAYAFGDQGGL